MPDVGQQVEVAPQVLRTTRDRASAEELGLVLLAEGIPHSLEHAEEGWVLSVAPADAARASAAIASYEAENAPARAAPEVESYGQSRLPWIFAAGILAFQLATGERDPSTVWFHRGSAEAEAILRGEWWRVATALTLHADLGHAVGNAAVGAPLLAALVRRLGPAASAWLALLSGAGGNALTAALVRAHFVSVGASTAVFGALGALTAAHAIARAPGAGRRAWLAAGAGIALLGFLGTGERADLLAHLCGFFFGALLGWTAALLLPRPPRRRALQGLLAAGALAAVAACWALAVW